MHVTIPIANEHRLLIRFPMQIGEQYRLTKSQTNHVFAVRGCLPDAGTVMVDTRGQQYKWVIDMCGGKNVHKLERIK